MKRDYTEEQVAFLREGIVSMPTRKLADAFSERFGIKIAQTQLRRVLKRYGIENPRKEFSPLPIGTERYSEYYDCVLVKVADTSVAGADKKDYAPIRQKNWQMKQNLVWERKTGRKLGWREVVMFLDGDRTNYDPDNLYAVPMNVAGTLKRMDMTSEDPEINKTALMWGQLYYTLPEKDRERIKAKRNRR